MYLTINGDQKNFTDHSSLQDIMSQLGYRQNAGLAVAVNEQVIPKSEWSSYRPETGDTLTIIRAVQGG